MPKIPLHHRFYRVVGTVMAVMITIGIFVALQLLIATLHWYIGHTLIILKKGKKKKSLVEIAYVLQLRTTGSESDRSFTRSGTVMLQVI